MKKLQNCPKSQYKQQFHVGVFRTYHKLMKGMCATKCTNILIKFFQSSNTAFARAMEHNTFIAMLEKMGTSFPGRISGALLVVLSQVLYINPFVANAPFFIP